MRFLEGLLKVVLAIFRSKDALKYGVLPFFIILGLTVAAFYFLVDHDKDSLVPTLDAIGRIIGLIPIDETLAPR